jgi:hypothetical protein
MVSSTGSCRSRLAAASSDSACSRACRSNGRGRRVRPACSMLLRSMRSFTMRSIVVAWACRAAAISPSVVPARCNASSSVTPHMACSGLRSSWLTVATNAAWRRVPVASASRRRSSSAATSRSAVTSRPADTIDTSSSPRPADRGVDPFHRAAVVVLAGQAAHRLACGDRPDGVELLLAFLQRHQIEQVRTDDRVGVAEELEVAAIGEHHRAVGSPLADQFALGVEHTFVVVTQHVVRRSGRELHAAHHREGPAVGVAEQERRQVGVELGAVVASVALAHRDRVDLARCVTDEVVVGHHPVGRGREVGGRHAGHVETEQLAPCRVRPSLPPCEVDHRHRVRGCVDEGTPRPVVGERRVDQCL